MNSEAIAVELAPGLVEMRAATTQRSPLYAAPPRFSKTLRVVMVTARLVPAWTLRFLDLVRENEWLDLVILPLADEQLPRMSTVPADLRALLAYERRRSTAPSLAPVAIHKQEGIAINAPLPAHLDVGGLRAHVSALRPDLILWMGAPERAEALGDRAEWGCWDFDSSLTEPASAAQALLGPVMRGEVATELELQLHHVDRPPTTLVTSWGSTCRTSVMTQCEQAFRKIPALLMRSLRQLASGELDVPSQRTARLQLGSMGPAAGPGAGIRTLAVTLALRSAIRWRKRPVRHETPWQVVIRHDPELMDPQAPYVGHHSILSAPGRMLWADPCVVVDGDRRFLFVEQWSDTDAKGVIACLELLPDAQSRQLGIALDRPFHLSFPQPIHWQGQWYMTVESGQGRCVSLYRADAFPFGWQHLTDLITGWNCVDPTLHHDGSHWYLFANVAESGGNNCDDLFLFVADTPMGPFRPHPANPIVSDARCARSAGRLFERDGRLIRPSQDCAPWYGAALVFNEVLELSPTHYRECPLTRLDAGWASGLDGCHTYNEAGGIEVLDARGSPPESSVRMAVLDMQTGLDPIH